MKTIISCISLGMSSNNKEENCFIKPFMQVCAPYLCFTHVNISRFATFSMLLLLNSVKELTLFFFHILYYSLHVYNIKTMGKIIMVSFFHCFSGKILTFWEKKQVIINTVVKKQHVQMDFFLLFILNKAQTGLRSHILFKLFWVLLLSVLALFVWLQLFGWSINWPTSSE